MHHFARLFVMAALAVVSTSTAQSADRALATFVDADGMTVTVRVSDKFLKLPRAKDFALAREKALASSAKAAVTAGEAPEESVPRPSENRAAAKLARDVRYDVIWSNRSAVAISVRSAECAGGPSCMSGFEVALFDRSLEIRIKLEDVLDGVADKSPLLQRFASAVETSLSEPDWRAMDCSDEELDLSRDLQINAEAPAAQAFERFHPVKVGDKQPLGLAFYFSCRTVGNHVTPVVGTVPYSSFADALKPRYRKLFQF